MILTIVSQFIWPSEWWFFWPLAIWSMVFFLHVMTIKTIFVDEDWVNERTDKLSENAFDFGHIETIRDQISKKTYGEAYHGDNKTFDPDTKK
ncbi:MAG: hypothetical protein HQ483_09290 [Rhodospirillales bacterium]|nr:hypothetical protein [Rhodospirillales bacterium]